MGRRHEALADEIHVRMRSLSEQPPDGCFCCAVHAGILRRIASSSHRIASQFMRAFFVASHRHRIASHQNKNSMQFCAVRAGIPHRIAWHRNKNPAPFKFNAIHSWTINREKKKRKKRKKKEYVIKEEEGIRDQVRSSGVGDV